MNSLTVKLSVTFLAVSLLGIALVALLANRVAGTASQTLVESVNREVVASNVADYFAENGTWPPRGPGRGVGGGWLIVDEDGVVLDGGGRFGWQGQTVTAELLADGEPIVVDGVTVGLLVDSAERGRGAGFGRPDPISAAQARFVGAFQRALVQAALIATLLSVGLGIIVTRTLTKPLHELTEATQHVAQGDLGVQVPIRSDDELGQLAASFNQMNADLAHARDLRQQMAADIAHDLRTPLSVILGHTEALKDGVLPATDETFFVIHDEALQLNRLVEDLRTLSLADAGELHLVKRPVAPHTLVERAVAAHSPQAQAQRIKLVGSAEPDLPNITVDPDRMAQVLDNLISNALRHTPSDGTVTISASASGSSVRLAVADTGEGIAPERIAHVFDRFYRADESRQRESGGSGLGLAISKSIVEQHGGEISAESQLGYGTIFTVTLNTM